MQEKSYSFHCLLSTIIHALLYDSLIKGFYLFCSHLQRHLNVIKSIKSFKTKDFYFIVNYVLSECAL